MAGGGGGDVRTLDLTPTWAVAAVCAVIVLISIVIEKIIHKFEKVYITIYNVHFFPNAFMNDDLRDDESSRYWFQMFEAKKKHALLEALEKIKGGKQPQQAHNTTLFVPPCDVVFLVLINNE